MGISKKHYELIASRLANPDIKSKGQIINMLADIFERDNPRFNRTKFVQKIAINKASYYTGRTRKHINVGGKTMVI